MMKHIYLEVDVCEDHAIITDWTDWFRASKERGHWREIDSVEKRFVTVFGNTHIYHVAGLGKDEKRCQNFAIWYHVTRASASDRTYRLD